MIQILSPNKKQVRVGMSTTKPVSTHAHQFRLQWLMLGLGLLALASMISYVIIHEYNRINAMEQERLMTQAKVVDINVEHQLVALNSVLLSIINDLGDMKIQKSSEALVTHHLQAMNDAMQGIRTIIITDAKGTVTASNRNQLIGQNFRNREYFRVPFQGHNQAMLYISPPFKTVHGVLP